MRLFVAGMYTSNFDIGGRIYCRLIEQEKEARLSVENYLESYHYIQRESYVARIRKDEKKVFLDSGAFSAFSKGVNVDLTSYCLYIKKNIDIIDKVDGILCASVLDSIGDAQGTYENQMAMERLGTKPLPCFHYGEDERYLEWYVSHYDYITIGGMVPISTPQLQIWLDRIWDKYLVDGSGRPRIRVHGFGLTSLKLTQNYPWFSVDSSTWVMWAANGFILLPREGKQLNISAQSPTRKKNRQHFDTFTDIEKEQYRKAIETDNYSTVERLQSLYYARWAWNCWAFPMFFKLNPPVDLFQKPQPELF
jgi:hypothetical protein